MLSDACFDVNEAIYQATIAALPDFEDDIEHYNEGFGYSKFVLQTLRLLISHVRSRKYTVGQFLAVTTMVKEFYDDPNDPSLEELTTRLEAILGPQYWLS